MNSVLDNKVMVECYRKGMTDKAIALQVGCPVRTVTSRRRALGLSSLYRKRTKERVTPERLDLQYANGLEEYYDKKAELNDAEYKARALMIHEAKLRLGCKYKATKELTRMFGPEE